LEHELHGFFEVPRLLSLSVRAVRPLWILEAAIMSRMPSFYKDPLGLPFYWEDDITGELPAAIRAYLDHAVDGKPFTAA